jgi:hypothetical protein
MKAFFSAEDIVEALYQGLLGRESDPDGLSHHAAALRRQGPLETVRALLASDEFRDLLGLGEQKLLTIVGNCNAPVLANCLRSGSNAWVRWVADVNERGTPRYAAAVAALHASQAGHVISVPFGGDFPDLVSTRLRELYRDRFFLMTNIHFTGLHPDITYFGFFQDRVHSVLGEYNSRIVLLSYLQGLDERDCLRRFNGATYEKLGYFRTWEESAEELRRREQGMDITFADEFLEMTRHALTLHSMNHPTSIAFVSQADCIARHLGLAARFLPDAFPNPLDRQVRWPVYPEIREAHRLPYETRFRFGVENGEPNFSLEEFVIGSYRRYEALGREAMMRVAETYKFPLQEI